jgi:superfamily I DNA/RNA helicase/mRNA-degrading endonuclease RelE of RelBE toxin-antitoxin system
MKSAWLTTMKGAFTNQWIALPPKEGQQVLAKIKLLEKDPRPDAKVKKQLKHISARLYRLRCGDYRIIYTFDYPYISLLALRRRQEDTYEEDFEAESLGGFAPELSPAAEILDNPQQTTPSHATHLPADDPTVADTARPIPTGNNTHNGPRAPVVSVPLPHTITNELLTALSIPTEFYPTLLAISTEEELLDCPGIPAPYLERLLDNLFPRPLEEIMQQPDLHLHDIDDLKRYKDGELLAFLLKLSPEQEKYVTWAINASGPTLLKGGPGSGKSTIALYRVRTLIEQLRATGRDDFRILFTTYTNALVRSSHQLLQQLLGPDMRYVDVQTADSVAMGLLHDHNLNPQLATSGESLYLLRQAKRSATLAGNILQQQARRQALERLGLDYLEQEIAQVIIARQLPTLDEYLAAPRPGRQVRLNALQRRAIWSLYEKYQELLQQRAKVTWQQLRGLAEELAARGEVARRYDAVIVDEAQDLDPSALRLLVHLCAQPNRLFITADANQSIYGSSFSWSSVHTDLRFQGRTAALRTNYRSTRAISEATSSYLAAGALEADSLPTPDKDGYANRGDRPQVQAVATLDEEAELLTNFLNTATHQQRLGLSSCAVLSPTKNCGQALARSLNASGLTATFMTGKEVDLERTGIKVLTLKGAKGLEFPIVALAGFVGDATFSSNSSGSQVRDEEQEEALAQDRRVIFVGMTRAMRTLLVIIPTTAGPMLQGFDETLWDQR